MLGSAALATTAAGHGVAAAAPPADRVPSILPPGDWTKDPDRSDEFTGTRIGDKWATDHWTAGGGGIHFDPERVTVHDERLHIEVRKPIGDFVPEPWRAGLVHSTFTIGGDTYLEVRAKMIPFAARVNSAIWVQQQAESNSDGDLNVEIDLQEYHLDNEDAGRQNVRSSTHLWKWTPQPPPHQDLTPRMGRTFAAEADLDEDFHMYGLERRRSGEVTLYFDGTPCRRLHEEIDDPRHRRLFATQERPLLLACNGLAPGVPAAEGDMEIDHVRVFTLPRPAG